MKKWLVPAIALLFPLSLMADCRGYGTVCCDWCDPMWSGGFEVSAEALYIRPTICNPAYVIEDQDFTERATEVHDPLPSGKMHALDPSHCWGFRAGFGYIFNGRCYDTRLTYAHLNCRTEDEYVPCDDARMWATLAPATVLIAGQAKQAPLFQDSSMSAPKARAFARWRNDWMAIQGELGARYVRCPNVMLRAHAGFSWTEICSRLEVEYVGSSNLADTKLNQVADIFYNSRTWGIGPQLGIEAQWNLCYNFGLRLGGAAALMVGDARHSQEAETFIDQGEVWVCDSHYDIDSRTRTALFPKLDAFVALNYLFSCGGCWSVLGEVGYELRTYISALDRVIYDDSNALSSAVLYCDSFRLDGLFLKLQLRF